MLTFIQTGSVALYKEFRELYMHFLDPGLENLKQKSFFLQTKLTNSPIECYYLFTE